jgi:hypothetical protein
VGQVTFSGERNSPLSLSFQFIPQIVKNPWGGYGNSSVQQILRYSAVSDLINSPTSSIMISYRSFLTVAMKFSALAMVSIGSDISNDRSSACSRPIYSLAILSASSPTPRLMLSAQRSQSHRPYAPSGFGPRSVTGQPHFTTPHAEANSTPNYKTRQRPPPGPFSYPRSKSIFCVHGVYRRRIGSTGLNPGEQRRSYTVGE